MGPSIRRSPRARAFLAPEPFDGGHKLARVQVLATVHEVVRNEQRLARNEAVPEALRGSYAGLAHPASIAHLRGLGITAVSLLRIASVALIVCGLMGLKLSH